MAKRGLKHKQETAGPDGWTRWIQPIETGYRMSCCDCGLVHEMGFRIEDGRVVLFRMRRHNRATAAMRAAKRRREQIDAS